MKHRGPSHEPCGTALFIVSHDDMCDVTQCKCYCSDGVCIVQLSHSDTLLRNTASRNIDVKLYR